MKHFVCFSLLLAVSAFGASKNSLDAGLGIGYRKDHLAYTLSQSSELVTKEGNDLHGIPIDGYFEMSLYGIVLSTRNDIGWYVSGNSHNMPFLGAPDQPSYQTSFHQSANGFFADTENCLGCVFDFTNRQGGFRIIPEGGYSVQYQNISRGSNHPESELFSSASISSNLSHDRLERLWYGPLVGGYLDYQFKRAWTFEAGYFYYFLHFYQSFASFSDVDYSDPSTQFFIRTKSRAHLSHTHGQSFRAKMGAMVADSWKVNFRLIIDEFKTKKEHTTYHQDVRELFPAPSSMGEKKTGQIGAFFRSMSLLFEVEYFY